MRTRSSADLTSPGRFESDLASIIGTGSPGVLQNLGAFFMVPDIEREWVAEECRQAPRPPWLLLILILLVVGVLWIFGGC